MVSAKPKQQEIVAELAKLRKQHVEALAKSTFGGFTSTEEAGYQEHVKRTASLVQQLEALDETSEWARVGRYFPGATDSPVTTYLRAAALTGCALHLPGAELPQHLERGLN